MSWVREWACFIEQGTLNFAVYFFDILSSHAAHPIPYTLYLIPYTFIPYPPKLTELT